MQMEPGEASVDEIQSMVRQQELPEWVGQALTHASGSSAAIAPAHEDAGEVVTSREKPLPASDIGRLDNSEGRSSDKGRAPASVDRPSGGLDDEDRDSTAEGKALGPARSNSAGSCKAASLGCASARPKSVLPVRACKFIRAAVLNLLTCPLSCVDDDARLEGARARAGPTDS